WVPSAALQSSMTWRSARSGEAPVTLYQPKALRNRALPRVTTLNVSGQVGRKVCGTTDAAARGSSPARFDGMQLLSLTLCQIVVSQVPVCPLAQLGEPPGPGAPILHCRGVVH